MQKIWLTLVSVYHPQLTVIRHLLTFFTWKPLSDWKRPPGRPNHTWLRAIESYPRPLNFGPSYPWKEAASREHWRSIVDTAMLKNSMP